MRFLSQDDKNKMMLVQEEPRGPSQLIEVDQLANGLDRLKLPDVSELRNESDQIIIIKAIRIITADTLTNAPISGNPVAPLGELQKCTIDLYCEGWVKGSNIPLLEMNDIFTEGSGTPWRNATMKLDSWRNVDWSKSFINYSNGTLSAGAPYTFVFEVEYVKMRIQVNTDGSKSLVEIVGPS